jgi:hypothetical protein
MTAPLCFDEGRRDAATYNTINDIFPPLERSFPKKREAIMEGWCNRFDGLAIQYWMLWSTVIVAGFATWNIWASTIDDEPWVIPVRLRWWPKLNFTAAQFNS